MNQEGTVRLARVTVPGSGGPSPQIDTPLADQVDSVTAEFVSLLPPQHRVAFLEAMGGLRAGAVRETIDPVSKLLNRKASWHAFRHAVRTSRTGCIGVMFGDVDNFGDWNKRYGQPAGDMVLGVIGQILTDQARGAETFGRYGDKGDEFMAILNAELESKFHSGVLRLAGALNNPTVQLETERKLPATYQMTLACVWLVWPDSLNRRAIDEGICHWLYQKASARMHIHKLARKHEPDNPNAERVPCLYARLLSDSATPMSMDEVQMRVISEGFLKEKE